MLPAVVVKLLTFLYSPPPPDPAPTPVLPAAPPPIASIVLTFVQSEGTVQDVPEVRMITLVAITGVYKITITP